MSIQSWASFWRITGSLVTAAPSFVHPARQLDEAVEGDAQAHLEAEAEGEALVHEVVSPTSQPLFSAAQDLRLVHAHVVEEDLVELGVAGDLPQRLHRDAGRLHVEEEVGDALVLGRVGSVRASSIIQSAMWASDVHTFWPLIT